MSGYPTEPEDPKNKLTAKNKRSFFAYFLVFVF